ncbi:MAG: ThuA domain-containing protein [Kiritimatiellaeota bacterium]|nr:ThuA domain-containing protein [Kiritimatiellota bacterium]
MKQVIPALASMLVVPMMVLAQDPKPLPVVSEQDAAALEKLIGEKLTAKPQKARKVLVFSKCEGFVHGDAIVYGKKAIEIAAKTGAFAADFSDDYAVLADKDNLFKYDALVLNNTTHMKVKDHPAIVPNLVAFVNAGRGLCAIHAAADNFYDSPEAAALVGGLFDGHPWGGGGKWAFKLDDPDNPLNRSLKASDLKFGDEIYQQKAPYDRAKLHVLVSLDMSDENTAKQNGQKREDKDFAVSWISEHGKGRVFYTSFAHDKRAYMQPATLWHILDGLQYTLGDLEVKIKK